MNRLIPFLIALLLPAIMYCQSVSIYEEVELSSSLPYLKNATVFKTKSNALNQIAKKKETILSIQIPGLNNEKLVLLLKKRSIVSNDFTLIEKSQNSRVKHSEYILPDFYSGTVKGYENSQVSISLKNNKISGIIKIGNDIYNIGQYKYSNFHIIYKQSDLLEEYDFKCVSINKEQQKKEKPFQYKTGSTCTNAVNIYFECDYDMYLNFNSNSTDVSDYVTDLFNEVYTLYDNEDIPVQISQIVVWTSSDGYTNNSSGLYDFQNSLASSGFNGDLAHLLTNDAGNNGGIAYVDQLCGTNPYGYSDIVNSHNPYPTYSWDVQVITHELGHNFGSQHTHECVWGANGNEQIDDCGSVATGSGGACYDPNNPIIPSGGGTIMSYCHTQSAGINFNYGFGTEPGDLIRNRHSSCFCDNSTCATATVLTTNGTYFAEPNNGNGASNSNASHSDWFTFIPSSGGTLDIESCGEGVDTRLWLLSGSCSSLTFETYSDDDCDIGNGSNYASEIISYNLTAGVTYFIEWDNRWSSNSFDWIFTFTPSSSSVDVTCPGDYAGLNSCSSSDYATSVSGVATSTDSGATISYSDNMTSTTCQVNIDRTWVATDVNGSTASCIQLIDLTDTSAPIISNCPSNITVNSNNNCLATVSWAAPTSNDDCDAQVTLTGSHNPGDSFVLGTTNVTYTATDNCSNSSTCNFTVTVIDQCNSGGLEPCDDMYITINGTIVDSTYHAKMDINVDGILMSGDNAMLKAGHEIIMEGGFEVKPGAVFETQMEDCINN